MKEETKHLPERKASNARALTATGKLQNSYFAVQGKKTSKSERTAELC